MTEREIALLKKSLVNEKQLFVLRRCKKCGSTNKVERHHITYEPEKIEPLCNKCHVVITVLNTAAAIVTGINKENDPGECNRIRRKIWRWFLRKKKVITVYQVADYLGIDHYFTENQLQYIHCAGKRCMS